MESGEIIITGEVGARVHQFLTTKHAIKLESLGLKNSRGSALDAAVRNGYVPRELVARGNIIRRREAAIEYMEYVTTLLTAGGNARRFGEEIVTGRVEYAGEDDCGCPSYRGTADSEFIQEPDSGVMCIHRGE